MLSPNVRYANKKRAHEGSFQLIDYDQFKWSYHLLNPAASEAACAYFDCPRCSIDQGFYIHEIRLENTFDGHADMLTDTTFLLGLTFSGYAIAGNRSFSTNLTSSCHVLSALCVSLITCKRVPENLAQELFILMSSGAGTGLDPQLV